MPLVTDCLGWSAAALTLLTFLCDRPQRLRAAALAANLSFILWALSAELWPVLALHLLLAPINVCKLIACSRGR